MVRGNELTEEGPSFISDSQGVVYSLAEKKVDVSPPERGQRRGYPSIRASMGFRQTYHKKRQSHLTQTVITYEDKGLEFISRRPTKDAIDSCSKSLLHLNAIPTFEGRESKRSAAGVSRVDPGGATVNRTGVHGRDHWGRILRHIV